MSENPPEQGIERQDDHGLRVVQRTTTVSGPLPPPGVLQQYDTIVPGAAERIITKFEEQARHRQQIESRVIASDIRRSTLGLVFAFILGLIAIAGGIFLASQGQPVTGTIFGGTFLVATITIFVYGSQQRRRERQEREQVK